MSDNNPIFNPYNLALEIERYFAGQGGGVFEGQDYINLIETIQTTRNLKNQTKMAELFKTLTKQEVIRRVTIVSRLSRLTTTINTRKYALSSPSTI